VLGGADANAYLVSAMHDGQLALYLVASDAAGMRAEPYSTQDGGRAVDLYLKDTPALLITADGLTAGAAAEAMGIAWLCAEGVGIMERMLAITVDYMNTRQQFGKTIASFQALRHRVADVKMALELARSMSYYATLKLNAVPEERDRAMARAKVQLGQSMRLVGQACIQLHGGIGVTDEVAISHYFKRLTQMEMQCGDTLHHLGRVSDQMQATAGVFA
jgi:alkylation response protein AidB-like acyl-CoA dehydrogenase